MSFAAAAPSATNNPLKWRPEKEKKGAAQNNGSISSVITQTSALFKETPCSAWDPKQLLSPPLATWKTLHTITQSRGCSGKEEGQSGQKIDMHYYPHPHPPPHLPHPPHYPLPPLNFLWQCGSSLDVYTPYLHMTLSQTLSHTQSQVAFAKWCWRRTRKKSKTDECIWSNSNWPNR